MQKIIFFKLLVLLLLSRYLYADSILIHISNDIINSTDKHLTNSIKLSYMLDINDSYFTNIAFTLTQDIYTPEDLQSSNPADYDIPYAGDLAGEILFYKTYPNYFYSIGLILGTIGEYSFAEEMQSSIHTLTGSTQPQGWENQIGNKLTFGASALVAYKTPKREFLYNEIELNTHAYLKVANNERTYSVGALLRYGENYPDNFALINHQSASQLNLSKEFSNFAWSFSSGVFYEYNDYIYILDDYKESYNIDRNYSFVGGIICGEIYYANSRVALNIQEVHFELHGKSNQERWIALSYLYMF